jgi:hypothetical protein
LAHPAALDGLSTLRRQPAHPAVDDRIARFFRDARAYSQLSLEQLAHQLATSPNVIASLETGAVGSFPPWVEVHRVVHGYAALARFDPRPLLEHIYVVTGQHRAAPTEPVRTAATPHAVPTRTAPVLSRAAATAAALAVTQAAPVAPRITRIEAPRSGSTIAAIMPTGADRGRRRLVRRLRRSVVVGCAALTLLGTTYWACHVRPAALLAVVNLLPAPMARQIRAGMDTVVFLSASKRDGLRWIDVENPRTRKTDKLPIASQ